MTLITTLLQTGRRSCCVSEEPFNPGPALLLLSANCLHRRCSEAAYSSSKSTSSLVFLSIRAAIRSRSLWPLAVIRRPPLDCVLVDTTSISSSCT